QRNCKLGRIGPPIVGFSSPPFRLSKWAGDACCAAAAHTRSRPVGSAFPHRLRCFPTTFEPRSGVFLPVARSARSREEKELLIPCARAHTKRPLSPTRTGPE